MRQKAKMIDGETGSLVDQEDEFTNEGAPPPGIISSHEATSRPSPPTVAMVRLPSLLMRADPPTATAGDSPRTPGPTLD